MTETVNLSGEYDACKEKVDGSPAKLFVIDYGTHQQVTTHTGLSPLGISAICGFVFTSNPVCSQGSTIIGLRIWIYFSHGFGVYSCRFQYQP